MTREDEQATLRARARELAKPRDRQHEEVSLGYTFFEAAGVRYAIESRLVFTVSHLLSPTPLPGAAPYWAGVSSVQGELLALVHLGVLLANDSEHGSGAAEAQLEEDGRTVLVLVLGTERRELGLLIDAVLDARTESFDLATTAPGDSASQLVLGTTGDGAQVLRGDALLVDPRLYIQGNHFTES